MGFFNKVFRELEKTASRQLADTVSQNTGINIRYEVRRYDKSLEDLQAKIDAIKESKDFYISQIGQENYNAMLRDIKYEISTCRQIRTDLLRETIEIGKEEQRERYREKMRNVSSEGLEKILENDEAPSLLRELAAEELRNRR